MAHTEQANFIAEVKRRFPKAFERTSVLEVGSYNVNGSVRQWFTEPTPYIGLDLAPGKDVDIVCPGHEFQSDFLFDVVISTECFEHDPNWIRTFANMWRLCKPQGLVLFTCAANNRHEHGTPATTPQDSALATPYYKNLNVIDFETTFHLRNMFDVYLFEARVNDLYFFGVKK